jgi:hypothetical protein
VHELAITENAIVAVTERIGSKQVVRVQFLIGTLSA